MKCRTPQHDRRCAMADVNAPEVSEGHDQPRVYEFGGLRFDVSFRGPGATLRVLGKVGDRFEEMLRFDDFVEDPHFHAPPAVQMKFDRSLGEPLAWYIAQIRDHLAEWLEKAGYASVLADVDVDAVTENAGTLEAAMEECVPEGYARVPGVGLQKV
jgi:hypothetical protein